MKLICDHCGNRLRRQNLKGMAFQTRGAYVKLPEDLYAMKCDRCWKVVLKPAEQHHLNRILERVWEAVRLTTL